MVLSKLMNLIKLPTGGFILSVAIPKPIESAAFYDVVDKDLKTVRSYNEFKDTETGLDRIKMMFKLDEYDNVSPELHTIYNSGALGLFVGIVYGGYLGSKKAYMDFMERNQATAFETHLAAKKKLQEAVTLNFIKSGWKLGWRMGIFAFMYMGVSTCMSVYFNRYSIFDYITAGVVTGGVYKWNLGPRGMAAGALVGGGLGTVAGGVTVGLLALTGTTMEEVRYWQYKWKTDRDDAYKEGFEKGLSETPFNHKNVMQDLHDIKVGVTRPNLDQLSDEPEEPKKDESETKKEESKKEENQKKSEK